MPVGPRKPNATSTGPRLPVGGSGKLALRAKPTRSTTTVNGPKTPATEAPTSKSTPCAAGFSAIEIACTSTGPTWTSTEKRPSRPADPVRWNPVTLDSRTPGDSAAEIPSGPSRSAMNESASGDGLTTTRRFLKVTSTNASNWFVSTREPPAAIATVSIDSRLASAVPRTTRSGSSGEGGSVRVTRRSVAVVVPAPPRKPVSRIGSLPGASVRA